MKNKFCFLKICIFTLSVFTCKAQQFLNGDLEGPASGTSVLPPNWQNVPFNDVNCQATHAGYATPDLTDTIDIGVGGILGRPYSGFTFMSGMYGGDTVNYFFQEGIMQNVSGLEINHVYVINFHQSVVKQDNALDKSGSWAVYVDNILAGITSPTFSNAPYNSISFIWESRNITFTATAISHLIKFLPVDDDTDTNYSLSDVNGALRMGIDSINLNSTTDIKVEDNLKSASLYPNPALEAFTIELPEGKTFSLLISDMTGRKIYEKKNSNGIVKVDCNNFSSGIYFVQATNNENTLTYKLIKK